MYGARTRAKNAKFTKEIYEALFKLVTKEDDFTAPKKHKAAWYRDEIGQNLKLRETENPSLRSYEDKLNEIRDISKIKNPLDATWTIGSCLKYDIPSQFISTLLTLDGVKYPSITIREARWFCKIFEVINPIAKKQYPDNPDMQMCATYTFARDYAFRERIAEITAKENQIQIPDTNDIDKIIAKGDFSGGILGMVVKDYTYSDKALEFNKKDGAE